MTEQGLKTFSGVSAALVNSLIFAGMAWAGMADELPEANPEPPAINVTLAALPRKGVERDPNALPRIIKAPEPPAPETDAINLARKKAEEEEEAKKKKEADRKRELAEKKQRLEDERQREIAQKRKERDERAARKKAMNAAMNAVDDRGDEDAPEGFKDGHEDGTAITLSNAQNAYVSLVSTVLQRQFEVPAVVPADQRKRLETHVLLLLDGQGSLKAEPKIVKASGNNFFDQAALRAAKRFEKGSKLRIPLPSKGTPLRTLVLKEGITARMKAR